MALQERGRAKTKSKRTGNAVVHLPPEQGSWSPVTVGDDFFVGSDLGGFLGLEEFKPASKASPGTGAPIKTLRKAAA